MSKKILITGCSTGFGFEAAKYLANKGHQVYATMRGTDGKNEGAATSLRDFAKSDGLKLEVLELDVTSDDSVAAAVAKIPEVDVLINNAGVGFGGPIEAFTSKDFASQIDVNLVGAFRVAKAVLRLDLRQQVVRPHDRPGHELRKARYEDRKITEALLGFSATIHVDGVGHRLERVERDADRQDNA